MKKALIITGALVQDHEIIYPYYRLREEGFEVTIALKDAKPVVGILGTKVPSDELNTVINYEQLDSFDGDLLILPGGAKCMEKLRQEQEVLDYINKWNLEGKVIGSICHGAQLLISAKATRGKKISSYYSIKDDVSNSGAEYVDAPFVTSGNIVTSPHYKHLGDWMKEVLRVYEERKSVQTDSQEISLGETSHITHPQ